MPSFFEMREAMATGLPLHSDIEALVWAGSSADVARADEWSDLDFFVVTREGAQEQLRRDLSWLPFSAGIALAARETAHGLKVLFDDGLVLEFAVFDRHELSQSVINHHAVAFGDVHEAVQRIHRSAPAPSISSPHEHLALAYTLLVIAVGRARRGEHLVAGLGVRSYAVSHLLQAAHGLLPNEQPEARDGLDVWRRAELQFPELAAAVREAAAKDVEPAAWALCDLMERHFAAVSDVPAQGAAVFRRIFGA